MAGLVIAGQSGVQALTDGVSTPPRLIRTGEFGFSEIHGRFYEQNYRANLYANGITTLTSINAATFTSATTGATATPIVGVWNPATSSVNVIVLQAVVGFTLTAATVTGGAPFVWLASVGNSAITTGVAPWNRKTLAQTGSQAKGVSGVALTGLTNTLSVMFGSAITGGASGNFSFVGTAAGDTTIHAGTTCENLDGSIIVPPGGVLGLFATTTPVAHSVTSSIFWEEVPL